MKVPTNLKHQPIIKLENYAEIDGNYDPKTTDTQGLSLGLAQWPGNDLSVKVWRHTGDKWSRQSEEVPLHRVIDLTSLICGAVYFTQYGKLPDSSLEMTMSANKSLHTALKNNLTAEYVEDNLDEPFRRLSKLLKDLGY